MRILLAVDGSPYTQKMLDYLATHAEWLGDTHSYVALTVQPPLPPRAAKALGKELVNDYHVEEAQKVLAPVHQFVETHKLNAQCESKVGHIAETIAEMALEMPVRFDAQQRVWLGDEDISLAIRSEAICMSSSLLITV